MARGAASGSQRVTTTLEQTNAPEIVALRQALLDDLPLAAGVLVRRAGTIAALWLNAAAVAQGFDRPALGLVAEACAAWTAACAAADSGERMVFNGTSADGGRARITIAPLAGAEGCFSFFVEPVPSTADAQPATDAHAERAQIVLDQASVGVILYDMDGRVSYANALAAEYAGLLLATLTGRSFEDCPWRIGVDGKALETERHPFLAAAAGRAVSGGYLRGPRTNGHGRTLLEGAAPLHRADGALIGVSYALTDVTDFSHQQSALRASHERYERLVDAAREGVFELDADGLLLAANPAFARMFGYDSVEAFTRFVNSAEAAPDQRLKLLTAIVADGDIVDREVMLTKRRDEPLWVLLSAHALRDKSGALAGVEGTVLDITARKHWEQGLRRQNEYLEALHQTALGVMDGHDPAAIMDAVLRRATEFVDGTQGFVYIVDPDGGAALVSGAALGVFTETRERRIAQGDALAGCVWANGEPLLIEDYDRWPGRAPWLPQGRVGSVAGVPLIAGERIVGVLGVAREPGATALQLSDVALLEQFAPLAALALDNAALYRRLGERLSRAQALTRLNQLISASLDIRAVLSEITSAAARLLDVPFASFWLVDEANRTVALRAYSDPVLGSSFPEPVRSLDAGGNIGWIVRERRPRNITPAEPSQLPASEAWRTQHGFENFYGFPVLRGEAVLGVLGFNGPRPFNIGPEEEELLETLAAQAAVAIHNAGLYEQLGAANTQLLGWVSELERRSEQIHLLSEMGELLQSCLTAEEAYAVLGDTLGHIFPDAACALYVLNASRTYAEALVSYADGAADAPVFRPDECWALRRGRMHVIADKRTALRCRHVGADDTPYVCVPMMAQGEATGVLHVRFHSWSGLDASALEAKQRLAQTVAEQTALALANLKLRETLRNQAIRDQLTGLYNRRYMEESLTREIHRATRAGSGLGVLMLDLDHFKLFNDAHGHAAGDVLLREVCAYLGEHVRGEDIACRYGGEELTLILPDVTLDEARQRADDLRRGVSELIVRHRGEPLGGVTVSIGVAVLPYHGTSSESLLQSADDALYQAKALGRDRVVMVGE
jgi:diguanylate cyclase (GGDEF)-like protein/PAS domain S-box-containing protein